MPCGEMNQGTKLAYTKVLCACVRVSITVYSHVPLSRVKRQPSYIIFSTFKKATEKDPEGTDYYEILLKTQSQAS